MRRLGLALLLVAAACAGNSTDAAETTTTTAAPVAEPVSTSTNTTVAATTTKASRPRLINPGTNFEPDTVYRGRLPAASIEFELEFGFDGWEVLHIPANTGNYLALVNHDLNQPTSTAATVIAWRADETPAEVAAWYRSQELVIQSTEPQSVMVSDNDALQFDLLVDVTPDRPDPCWGFELEVDDDEFGGGFHFENLHPCTWIRMWVIQVDEFAVSAYVRAATFDRTDELNLDPDNIRHIEDFQPLLDDFINGLTFCTTATPCDD